MKQTRIPRLPRRKAADRGDDRESQELLPLTAREFLKLSMVPQLRNVMPRRDEENR